VPPRSAPARFALSRLPRRAIWSAVAGIVGASIVLFSDQLRGTYGGWHFAVLKDAEPNGISGPGGFVFVTRGALDLARNEDEVAAILWCIDHEVTGPMNLAAPGIVTMKEFAKALGHALQRPSWAPVPAAALKILLGEFASALLEGQRAVPKKLLDSGFRFRFEEVNVALRDLFPGG